MLDGEPDTLREQGGNQDAPVVVHPADIFWHFLVLRLVHLDNVLDHWEVPTDTGKLHAQIALGSVPAGGLHVFLASPPHQAEYLVKWEAVLLEFLNGHGGGIAKEVPHDPVSPHTARDVEHLRGHLDPGCRHGKLPALIALHLADALEDRQGFLPSRVIVV